MYSRDTQIISAHAANYLNTLCRHFARKIPARWDEQQGKVNFQQGVAHFTLINAQQLTIHIQATEEPLLNQLQAIIDHHVQLFSRREQLTLHWQPG